MQVAGVNKVNIRATAYTLARKKSKTGVTEQANEHFQYAYYTDMAASSLVLVSFPLTRKWRILTDTKIDFGCKLFRDIGGCGQQLQQLAMSWSTTSLPQCTVHCRHWLITARHVPLGFIILRPCT